MWLISPTQIASLTAYIRCCPNLHTVRLEIWEDTLYVLRQLPGFLSNLVFLRRIVFRFWAEADVALMDENEEIWTAVDTDLAVVSKFGSLEYVEVMCVHERNKGEANWWVNDTGSREDGQMDSGRESDGEGQETGGGKECNSRGTIGRWKNGRQQQGVESASNSDNDLPSELRHTMNGVAYFHHHKKALTDSFPPSLCSWRPLDQHPTTCVIDLRVAPHHI